MYNFEVERRLDNGARVKIRVAYRDHLRTFIVDDVLYIEKGKRNGVWLCGPRLTDNYSYRRLNMEQRRQREIEEILKYMPVEVLNDALLEAWNQTKPKPIQPTLSDVIRVSEQLGLYEEE